MMGWKPFGALCASLSLLIVPSACGSDHSFCPPSQRAVFEDSLEIASLQLMQTIATPKRTTEAARASAFAVDALWPPPLAGGLKRPLWWAAPSPSLAFRCQQLLPLGSRGLALCLCLLLSLGTCAGVRTCLDSKAAPMGSSFGERRWVCPCGLCLCACLSAIMCWGLHGRLEFVHIPKNAGTNVEYAGLAAGISWGVKSLAFRGDRRMPDGSFCSGYHTPPALIHGLSPYAGAETFCVTRHPFERAVSEYSYLLSHYWGRRYSELHHTGLYDYPQCTEDGLNHYVQTTLRSYGRGLKYIDDCHHVPQVEYIWDRHGARMCAHIFRLDELPEAFNRFMSTHGYPVQLAEEKVYSAEEFCPNLSVDSLAGKSKRMLLEIYADDFRLLNYSVALHSQNGTSSARMQTVIRKRS